MTAPYDRIARSADCYLYDIDPACRSGAVLHVDRAFFRDAAFLDQRAVAQRRFGGWRIQLDALHAALAATASAPTAPAFIFHLGHCGSTLISRVLDGLPMVLGLREPLALLHLAVVANAETALSSSPQREQLLGDLSLLMRMLERGFDHSDRIVIKATSVASCLAADLLALRPDSRALLLAIRLPDYLASYLRDPGLRESARRDAGLRLSGYRDRPVGEPLSERALSDAEFVALNWLLELDRFARLLNDPRFAQRVGLLDFADWLSDPAAQTAAVCRLLAIDASAEQITTALGNDRLGRYAKDPTQRFDAGTRTAELLAAHSEHREAIASGMRFVDTQLQRQPGIWRIPAGWH